MESNNVSNNDHRFICKSVDSTTVYYTKISIDAEVDTEYPRGLDDNVEILGREAERLEEKFKKAVIRCKSDLEQQQCHEALVKRKDEEIDDDEDDYEPIGVSPCGRFFKYNKEVGRGSFKTVFRGLDTQTGVAVAWCELMDDKVNKEERIRFREEADMLKNLQHPNILRFYNYWETTISKKKNIVLVTELMLSGTLKSYLSRFKKINPKVLKSWCRQILKGLHFLHSRKPPIIHRDVKCDNVFITGTTGSVKIGDLGLATLKNRSFAKSVIGTPEFMAPEMYDEHYDEAVDVYAFGMCMLEMATGEYPYSECSGVAQIYKRVTSGTMPESIEKVGNKELREIIERCITLNKNDRPNCMGLLKSEFFAIDMGTPIEPIRLEPIAREKFIDNPDITSIEFQLRFLDPKKRLRTHREDEAIQFHFDVNKDDCDRITQEMCKANVTAEEDSRTVAKLLKSQILLLLKEREERSLHRQLHSNGNGVNESSLINSHQNGSPPEQNGIPQYREIVSRSQQPNVTKSVINIRAKTSATQLLKKPSRFTVNPTTIEPPQQAAALVPQQNHSNIQHANLAQKHSSPTIIPVSSPSDQPTTQRHVQSSLHATNKTQTAHSLNCRSSETLMPKLIVLTVQNEAVHCQLEAMGKVIPFKLDANVSNAVEVTKELIFSGQLAESQSSSFIDIINDIIKQLKEHPNQLPVINQVQEISEQAPSIIPVPKKRSQPSLQPLVNIPESTASQAEPSSLSPLTIEQIAKASSKITELADLQIELARLNQRVSVFVTEQHYQVKPKQLDAETTVTTPVKTDSNSDFDRSSSNPAAPLHISVSMSSSSATNTLSTATSGLSSTATSPSTQSSAENTNIDDRRKPRRIIVSLVDDVTKPTCKVQPQNIVDSPSSLSTSGADEILIMEKSLGTPPSPPSAANSKEQVLNEEEEEEEENTTVPPPPSPEITDAQTTVTTIKSICTLDRMRIEKDIVAINIPPQSVDQDVPDQTAETLTDMEKLKKSSVSRLSTLADDDAQSICTAHPHLISSMVQSDIKTSLERVRNQLTNVRLETNVRQRLVLLIQRQHIEEEEIRLKHLVELEKFHKTLETRYHIPKSLFNVKPSVLSSSSNESLEY